MSLSKDNKKVSAACDGPLSGFSDQQALKLCELLRVLFPECCPKDLDFSDDDAVRAYLMAQHSSE